MIDSFVYYTFMTEGRLTRRDLFGAVGATLAAFKLASATEYNSKVDPSPLAIPGPYPGRVIGIEHRNSLAAGNYEPSVITDMFRRGMQELTGAPDWQSAWRRFFEPGDVVGVKVNPVGQPYIISSQYVLWEIIQGLEAAGVKRNDIVVYDRYRLEFLSAGMQNWIPAGVRTMFAAEQWEEIQQSIAGYDPDHYMDLDYGMPGQNTSNASVRRSHVALFLTKEVNKLVNLTVLKDHQAAGVTLALKNLSHGLVNNVNRSHPNTATNYTDTFIPASVSIPVTRNKAVLHIVDGVRGLYHSGPHVKPQFLWDHHTLYFATDPVAVDRIGWNVIDQKRVSMGMKPLRDAPPDEFSTFLNRHPHHVEIAGMLGLGEWDLSRIYYRHIRLDQPRNLRRESIRPPRVGYTR